MKKAGGDGEKAEKRSQGGACRDLFATRLRISSTTSLPRTHHQPHTSHHLVCLEFSGGDGDELYYWSYGPVALPNFIELCIRSPCQPHPQQPRARSRDPGQLSSSSQHLQLHTPATSTIPPTPMTRKRLINRAQASIEAMPSTAAEDETPAPTQTKMPHPCS